MAHTQPGTVTAASYREIINDLKWELNFSYQSNLVLEGRSSEKDIRINKEAH